MLEISDDARELMLSCLEDAMEGRPELRRGGRRIGLRLNLRQGAAYLSLSFPRSTDQVVTFMGRPLLIVDPQDLPHLDRARLTVKRGPRGDVLSMEPHTVEETV